MPQQLKRLLGNCPETRLNMYYYFETYYHNVYCSHLPNHFGHEMPAGYEKLAKRL